MNRAARLTRLEERQRTRNPEEPFFVLVRAVAPTPDGPRDMGIHHCTVIHPPGHGRFIRRQGETLEQFAVRLREATGIYLGEEHADENA